MGKIGLNQSLIYIHHFTPPTPIFLCAPLQLVSQKQLFLGRKHIGGAFASCCPHLASLHQWINVL